MSKSRLVSGRAKKKLGTELSSSRYDYLDVSNAEPDLGVPPVDNSVLIGDLDGSRTWTDITEYAEQFKGYTGSKGQGFIIAKTYSSVAALTADTEPSGIAPGEFAIIDTDDVEDPENSKLYLWTGTSYNFVTDLSGEQGINGETGYTGSKGDIGFTGSQGDIGYTGSKGDVGFTGSAGTDGIIGADGATGFTGSRGDVGFTGSAGTDGVIGTDGANGATGFTGSRGDVGYTGSRGDVGFTGSAGTDGVIGADGADGATGFTGSQGDIGYTGSLGESSFTYGPDAPLNPAVGDRWYDSIDGAELVYTNDGDSTQWVEVAASGFVGQTGYTGSNAVSGGPKITDIDITDNSYTLLDDTAVSLDGGYIKITGSAFEPGCQVLINTVPAVSTTFINATEVRAQIPATAAGTYIVYLVNTDGGVAIRINGITFSGTPTWVTGSGLSGTAEGAISIQLSAAGAVSYSLAAGSTLPPDLTLSAGGLLSGTVTGVESETVFNFTVNAIDAELQDSPRSFAITITAGDAQIAYVTALLSPELEVLPFNRDASTNNFAVSVVGDTRPNNFGPYTPGYYSNFFDGTGDFLTAQSMTLGTSAFTIEFWAYPTSIPTNAIIFGTTTNGGIQLQTSGGNMGVGTYGVGNSISTSGSPFVTNRWLHIVVVRSGTGANQTSIFFNGVRDGNGTVSTNYVAGTATIGGAASQMFFGYISNFRVVIGTAVYDPTQTTLTVPTEPLTAIANTSLLTCQSNRFIDNSTNNFVITRNGDVRIEGFDPFVPATEFAGRGSAYFDGTGDYLQLPNSTALTLAGSAGSSYTLEAWIYPESAADFYLIVGKRGSASGSREYQLWLDSGTRYLSCSSSSGSNYISTQVVPLNTWSHVAVSVDSTGNSTSSTARLFYNGTLVATFTGFDNSQQKSTNITIGSLSDGQSFKGYISDARIVKGTALYTANFTPPTAPLTAIANTSLLTCQTNQPNNNNVFLDSSTNNFLVTRNGNATQGALSPYGGGWSYFNSGTGNTRLSIANNAALQFGTGDFTVEFWAYITGQHPTDLYTGFLSFGGVYGTANTCLEFIMTPNGGFGVGSTTNTTSNFNITLIAGSSGLLFNTWHHFAVSRSGTTVRAFTDGVLKGTVTGNSTNINGTGIGAVMFQRLDSSVASTPGYISNVRAVKGTAVYTAAFTPSTTPLLPITGTSLLTCADNRFVDDSPNNFAITRTGDVSVQKFNPFGIQTAATPVSYGAFFDGNNDYLTPAANAAFTMANQDFTYECWAYLSGTSPVNAANALSIFDSRTAEPSITPSLFVSGSGNSSILTYFVNGVAVIEAGSTFPFNNWTHVALVRNGGVTKLYQNGLQVGSTYNDTNNYVGTTTVIGGRFAAVSGDFRSWFGYISNARIVKGTAVYTSNFTPPTQPLTAITNTSLLTCQSATFIDNSTNNFAITAAGDARPSQTNPFGFTAGAKTSYTPAVYGGSMTFDYDADRLIIPYTPALSQTSPYTLEFWFYPNYTFTGQYLFARNAGGYFGLAWNGTSGIIRVDKHGVGIQITATTALGLNQWHHVAMTYDGTTTRLFTNGILQGSVNGTGGEASANTTIGYYEASTNSSYGGYMSDFRFVKGPALYTSSFVPPLAPLTPITNTTLLVNGTAAAVRDASMSNNLETVADARISTAVVKYGTTSMFFDGTGDYLVTPPSIINAYLWTRNLTVECWVYFNSVANAPHIWSIGESSTARCTLYVAGNVLKFYTVVSSGGDRITSSTTLATGQWYHIALTKSNGVFTLWLNGVSQGTSNTTVFPSGFAETIAIGFQNFGGQAGDYFNGYISDFRITQGHARYTANFTPRTAALPKK